MDSAQTDTREKAAHVLTPCTSILGLSWLCTQGPRTQDTILALILQAVPPASSVAKGTPIFPKHKVMFYLFIIHPLLNLLFCQPFPNLYSDNPGFFLLNFPLCAPSWMKARLHSGGVTCTFWMPGKQRHSILDLVWWVGWNTALENDEFSFSSVCFLFHASSLASAHVIQLVLRTGSTYCTLSWWDAALSMRGLRLVSKNQILALCTSIHISPTNTASSLACWSRKEVWGFSRNRGKDYLVLHFCWLSKV